MIRAFLLLTNILFLGVMIGLAVFIDWAGPSFALGMLCGAFCMASAIRLQLGYWP